LSAGEARGFDRRRRASPQVAGRFGRLVTERSQRLSIGVVFGGDRRARLTAGQVLVEPGRLLELERVVETFCDP
jgi:hypothetical protein